MIQVIFNVPKGKRLLLLSEVQPCTGLRMRDTNQKAAMQEFLQGPCKMYRSSKPWSQYSYELTLLLHTFSSASYIVAGIFPLSFAEQFEWIRKKTPKAKIFLFGFSQIAGEKKKVEQIIIESKLARNIADGWCVKSGIWQLKGIQLWNSLIQSLTIKN